MQLLTVTMLILLHYGYHVKRMTIANISPQNVSYQGSTVMTDSTINVSILYVMNNISQGTTIQIMLIIQRKKNLEKENGVN